MLTFESTTIFAAKGSRNMLNSAYLFEGIVKRFPFSLLSLICPPTTYTFCKVNAIINKVIRGAHKLQLEKVKENHERQKHNPTIV